MAVKPPRKGLGHMLDATAYSWAGLRRLLRETAARQELVGGAMGAALLFWAQAGAWHWLGFGVLFAALLAVEALNTAIEVVMDHVSPGWSEAARQAKDLGSLAVALMILANASYIGAITLMALRGGV